MQFPNQQFPNQQFPNQQFPNQQFPNQQYQYPSQQQLPVLPQQQPLLDPEQLAAIDMIYLEKGQRRNKRWIFICSMVAVFLLLIIINSANKIISRTGQASGIAFEVTDASTTTYKRTGGTKTNTRYSYRVMFTAPKPVSGTETGTTETYMTTTSTRTAFIQDGDPVIIYYNPNDPNDNSSSGDWYTMSVSGIGLALSVTIAWLCSNCLSKEECNVNVGKRGFGGLWDN